MKKKIIKMNAQIISAEKSGVKVYVIPTNEELMIATSTFAIYKPNQSN